MPKDIKELLTETTKNLLTPESLVAIEEAINAKADEKAKLQIETALVAQDDKHTEMLSQLLEKMDDDYTTKLQKLVERLDDSYATKLLKIKNFYDTKIKKTNHQLQTEAVNYVNALSNKIDSFLDVSIDRVLPEEKLNEAVKNTRDQQIVEQIRKLVGIDHQYIKEEVKEAILDGKQQLDESKSSLQGVVAENVQLKSQLAKKESQLVLEQKTAKLPSKKREHIKKVLSDKDSTFINENFEYVCDMYDRDEVIVSDAAKKETKSVGTTVDVTPSLITEDKKDNVDPVMKRYLQGFE